MVQTVGAVQWPWSLVRINKTFRWNSETLGLNGKLQKVKQWIINYQSFTIINRTIDQSSLPKYLLPMHKLLVSVHWFVDQFAICSSWWQMIETNFHFWIQTQFILKDYCWNPQLVELVNLLPRTRRHWGWYFSFFLRLRQLKARRTTLNYKQRLYFPQELKRRGQKPGNRGDRQRQSWTLFQRGPNFFFPTILVSDNFQVK